MHFYFKNKTKFFWLKVKKSSIRFVHWLKAYSLLLGSLNLPTQIVVCCSGELEIALVVIMSWMLHPANSSSLASCVLSLFGGLHTFYARHFGSKKANWWPG